MARPSSPVVISFWTIGALTICAAWFTGFVSETVALMPNIAPKSRTIRSVASSAANSAPATALRKARSGFDCALMACSSVSRRW
jgi:hypothetical protein